MLESRGAGVENGTLARELLAGFYETCIRSGLDGVLTEIEQAFAPLVVADELALADDPRLHGDLTARLGNKAEFDARGPRNAKPKQLADILIAVLALTPSDPPDRAVTLSNELRGEVVKALASVIDVQLGVPQIRESIITAARGQCEEHYHKSFDKIVAQLDERGMRAPQPLKIPLDAVQTVQRLLNQARATVVATAANAAIDRAKQVLAKAEPEAAERFDQPITHKLTPRQVAVQRVTDARAPKSPEPVVQSLLQTLTELSDLSWQIREEPAQPYSVSTTYAVGDVIDHPKFGRGTVKAIAIQRVDVQFADGVMTLVHARAK